MIATAVGFVLRPSRFLSPVRCIPTGVLTLIALVLTASPYVYAQTSDPSPAPASVTPSPDSATPAMPLKAAPAPDPIAIVPIDPSASVTGASRVTEGKALIANNGTITSGAKTTDVTLPHRGVLRVCASTSVHLSADASIPASESPGLMMALDHGAVETSFATGKNSDILLTPDFRILIGSGGSSQLKVRLGQHGDTCIDNPGTNAPFVVVSSVFQGGAYRVQPGQRVMFQHGSLSEVVDQEKEPCGCPPEFHPGTKDFPLAQSAGLAPLEKPSPPPVTPTAPAQPAQPLDEPLVYTAPSITPAEPPKPEPPTTKVPAAVPPQVTPPKTGAKPKPGFFRSVGRFFKKIFGGD